MVKDRIAAGYERLKAVWCALFGHTRIRDTFFGYHHCARCHAQVGDSLASVYSGKDDVVVGHGCDTCRENWDRLEWHERVFAPSKAEALADDAHHSFIRGLASRFPFMATSGRDGEDRPSTTG